MIVYHGSDTIVDVPRIIEAKRPLDFGGGFYVTTSEEQARKWAIKVAYRNANKHSYINKYEFDMERAKKETQVVCFERADEEWLDFICTNRQGLETGDYDIVIGPIADDSTTLVLTNFIAGTYGNPESESAINIAIQMLETMNLATQVVLKTNKAIQCLSEYKYEEVSVARRF